MSASARETPAPRRRDAVATRELLLDAAREHFARDGFRSTTVRTISEAAGVNVALINRYFGSKEGLFRACLAASVDDLGGTAEEDASLNHPSLKDVPMAMATRLAGPQDARAVNKMLLLTRASRDQQAEQIRLEILETFARRLATAAGWRPDGPDGARLILHAQIALSASLGIALLRASTALEPLASTGRDELVEPLRALIAALLPPEHTPAPGDA